MGTFCRISVVTFCDQQSSCVFVVSCRVVSHKVVSCRVVSHQVVSDTTWSCTESQLLASPCDLPRLQVFDVVAREGAEEKEISEQLR